METNLERKEASCPIREGKHHIINMVIGGGTQHVTRVQDMPNDVK
jgi:hypothetical protein